MPVRPAAPYIVSDLSPLERLLSRPNRLIAAALLLLCAVAWLQLYGWGPAAQPAHVHGAHSWNLHQAALILCMWLLMAVAMMLPTAAPAILAFADIARAGREGVPPASRVTGFVGGYLAVWWAFGVLATLAQWALASAAQRIPDLAAGHSLIGAAALVGAGLYQFSAIKDHCLTQCRSPMTFFLAHWRDGVRGALALGWRHGMHCVGCCWALMALMLATGSMNLAWTAALAVVMLAEKVLPAGRSVARIVGVTLICGAVVLAGTWVADVR